MADDAVSVIFYYKYILFSLEPLNPTRQRGQSSRAQDSVDWILTSWHIGFTCGQLILIVGIRTDPCVPTVRLGRHSPASPRPSSLHALASGTEPRKDCSCLLFLSWPDWPGFLRSAQLLTSSRARGSPGQSEERVWRRKKKVRRQIDWLKRERKKKKKSWKNWKWGKWPSWIYVKKKELYVLLERAGWRNGAEKCWKC